MKTMQSLSPSLLLSFLLLNFPFFFIQTSADAEKCHPDDELALLAFKSGITSDPSGLLSQWKSGTNCCIWPGISCQQVTHGRVDSFRLQDGLLSGTISPSLSKLIFLEDFSLRQVLNLSGPFPDFLYYLPRLKFILIDTSNLSGPLSEKIGSLTLLSSLMLVGNKFSGSLPDNLTSLTNLKQLYLNDNKFTGRIPSSISKLTDLYHLDLGGNLIRGTIPDSLRNLKNLTSVRLDRNILSGAIPDFFASFPELIYIDLSYNKLHGQIPASISYTAPLLYFLKLSHNALTGNIPTFIGNLHKLETLDLSYNHFTGTVPKSFSKLTKVTALNLAHNSLVDPFPALRMKYIQSLDLSDNAFHLGAIPKWVTGSLYAQTIKLVKCGINMKMEDWRPKQNFKHIVLYENIDLSENEISGSPVWLLNKAEHLVSFKASSNQLKFDLGSLKIAKTVKDLDLSRNLIFGKVPESLAGVKRLNLSYNDHLCGSPLPPCKV